MYRKAAGRRDAANPEATIPRPWISSGSHPTAAAGAGAPCAQAEFRAQKCRMS